MTEPCRAPTLVGGPGPTTATLVLALFSIAAALSESSRLHQAPTCVFRWFGVLYSVVVGVVYFFLFAKSDPTSPDIFVLDDTLAGLCVGLFLVSFLLLLSEHSSSPPAARGFLFFLFLYATSISWITLVGLSSAYDCPRPGSKQN